MNRSQKMIPLAVFTFLIFGSIQVAHAKRGVDHKHLKNSISEAMDRSHSDQERLKDRVNEENDEKIQNWSRPEHTTLEIEHTGTIPMGSTVGSSEEFNELEGEDQSGLDSLRSNVKEESTDIDFDEELREVSSMKD